MLRPKITNTTKIGFTGVPPLKLIQKTQKKFPNSKWIDLDVPITGINKKEAITYIPDTTCSIIQTILSNTLSIKPDVIIASVGKCKCDSMRFLIPIFKNLLPNTKIIECINNDKVNFGTSICTSNLPLIEKIETITDNVLTTKKNKKIIKTEAVTGFWGVPPYDFSVLKLFPNNTHVYGWTRCMENKTPNNPELEMFVDKDIPTVFFSQSFCQKNILAKELARLYKGLYVEVDGLMDSSTKAKISAFLELKNCF